MLVTYRFLNDVTGCSDLGWEDNYIRIQTKTDIELHYFFFPPINMLYGHSWEHLVYNEFCVRYRGFFKFLLLKSWFSIKQWAFLKQGRKVDLVQQLSKWGNKLARGLPNGCYLRSKNLLLCLGINWHKKNKFWEN